MLEELGLGAGATPADADVVVFNTCTIREKPDTQARRVPRRGGGVKRRDPDRVIAVGGCYAEAQRDRILNCIPTSTSRSGRARSRISATGSAQAGSGGTRTLRARRPGLCRDAPDAPRAAVPGVGAGVDGLQLDVRLLHRPAVRGARAEPPPRRDRGRGDASPAKASKSHAARPERSSSWGRDLADVRPSSASCSRLRRRPGIERIRFTSPHPGDSATR